MRRRVWRNNRDGQAAAHNAVDYGGIERLRRQEIAFKQLLHENRFVVSIVVQWIEIRLPFGNYYI